MEPQSQEAKVGGEHLALNFPASLVDEFKWTQWENTVDLHTREQLPTPRPMVNHLALFTLKGKVSNFSVKMKHFCKRKITGFHSYTRVSLHPKHGHDDIIPRGSVCSGVTPSAR